MSRLRRLAVLEAEVRPDEEGIAEIHRPIIAPDGKEVGRRVHVIGKGRLSSQDFAAQQEFEDALRGLRASQANTWGVVR